jgi:hypothetical protein
MMITWHDEGMHSTHRGHHARHGRHATTTSTNEITGWVHGSLPDDLYESPPDVRVDDAEILVVGDVGAPDVPADLDDEAVRAAEAARIDAFREATRDARIGVAQGAEARFGRTISWGATSGATTKRFTTVHAPVGTRLGYDHRRVLDALVEAGVASGRADALAWCVELVRRNQTEWLEQLEDALAAVRSAAEAAPA